jgi:hypothetical protein
MLKLKRIWAVTTIVAALSSSAFAHEGTVAVGLKVGTQGFGAEARMPIMNNVFGRLGVNYFNLNRTLNDGDLGYKAKMTLATVPLMVDYHPFDHSGFRLSAGIAYNGNKVSVKATPTKSTKINGIPFTPAQIGSVTGKLKLGNTIAPIVSIGYDSSFVSESPLSFAFEAGMMFSGKPKLNISGSGISGQQKVFIDALQADGDKAVKKAKKYLEFFPVLSIGVKYTF